MKIRFLFGALFALLCVSVSAQKTVSVSSPDGQTQVDITLSDRIYYDVTSHGEKLLQKSHIGMTLANATLARTLEKIPCVSVYFDPEGETPEPIARRMYVDPEKLPLLVVTKDGMTGIYASSGYNVGSVDLMLKILSR